MEIRREGRKKLKMNIFEVNEGQRVAEGERKKERKKDKLSVSSVERLV